MRNALIFSGQGAHAKGMCLSLLDDPAVVQVWERMTDCMMRNYGISLQHIIQENPKKVAARSDAFVVDEVCKRPCTEVLNMKESTRCTHAITHPDGVMQLTYLTQPCVLAAQLLAYEKLKHDNPQVYNRQISCIAGHSLGEFTALTALGVFSPETALNLTFKRGLLMEQACDGVPRGNRKLYACSPQRANLSDDSETADRVFFALLEEVAQSLAHTSSFVEVVNNNIRHQQYVVAGDLVGLAVLGKCLDPQYRANCASGEDVESLVSHALTSVRIDNRDGVARDPNIAHDVDFATSSAQKYGSRSTFRRFIKGADDGFTPSLDELTHLTLEEDGRSGLKKKSWFVPLIMEVPFHSSKLRRAMDAFLPVLRTALPDEAALRELLSISKDGILDEERRVHPLWITNLTGRVFDPLNRAFQQSALECMKRANIGEIRHKGRFESTLVVDTFNSGAAEGNVREMTAAVLAAQLAHPVQWITAMEEVVVAQGCSHIQEASPKRNTSEMFRRTSFFSEDDRSRSISLQVSSFPSEAPLF
ncbi:acyl transferase-like protein [Leishmania donovani]|uniref:[acyl-carrier-protein] S-malonyltransferase n=1 Tax=Leishmania donovani TaxID=5661 RepID=A0A6J8FMQ8_LEIDO|nr:acyl transferase-like protein [Leishmania donovani]VDZ48989.1 acyl_transferase-like_protein_putative/GeneDB:LmjF.35.3470 [Leishmania donovani]